MPLDQDIERLLGPALDAYVRACGGDPDTASADATWKRTELERVVGEAADQAAREKCCCGGCW